MEFIMLQEIATPNRVFEFNTRYPVSFLPPHTYEAWKRLGYCKEVNSNDISGELEQENNNTAEHSNQTARRKQKRKLDDIEDSME